MKKYLLKRAFCVGIVVVLLVVLSIPAFASSYYVDLPDDTLPSLMVSCLNADNNNYLKYRNAFKSGEEAPGVFAAPLSYYQENYLSSHFILSSGIYTQYCSASYGDSKFYFIVNIDGSDNSFSIDSTSCTSVKYNSNTGVLLFTFLASEGNQSPVVWYGGSALSDITQSAYVYYLTLYHSESAVYWRFCVDRNDGEEWDVYDVPCWGFVSSSATRAGLTDFESTIDYISSYYYNGGEYVTVSDGSSGSSSDPSNPDPSNPDPSNPDPSGSGSGSGSSVTPVDPEEEAVSVLASMRDFVFSMFMAPSVLLQSMLNFTIFGINLYTLFLTIITVLLTGFVISVIVKLILHLR